MEWGNIPSKAHYPWAACDPVDLTSDYLGRKGCVMRGIVLTASGTVRFEMMNGGIMSLPVAVPTNGFEEVRGYMIKKIFKAGTTATVAYAMY
jgi:hypothetical protein